MTVEEIYRDRETFSSRVQEVVGTELTEMGLEVKVFTIKDINDSVRTGDKFTPSWRFSSLTGWTT